MGLGCDEAEMGMQDREHDGCLCIKRGYPLPAQTTAQCQKLWPKDTEGAGGWSSEMPVNVNQSVAEQDKKFYLLVTIVIQASIRCWHNDPHFNYTSFELPSLHFAFPFHITSLAESKPEADKYPHVQTHT